MNSDPVRLAPRKSILGPEKKSQNLAEGLILRPSDRWRSSEATWAQHAIHASIICTASLAGCISLAAPARTTSNAPVRPRWYHEKTMVLSVNELQLPFLGCRTESNQSNHPDHKCRTFKTCKASIGRHSSPRHQQPGGCSQSTFS
ncbi:hypothetical protein LIA77_07648 [Sarocladium implicatum]|nr:hypothetical protein LIA77_07648 [Sarocladium implicatum]